MEISKGVKRSQGSGRFWAMGELGDPRNLLTLLFADASLGVRPSSRLQARGEDGVDDHRLAPQARLGCRPTTRIGFLTML